MTRLFLPSILAAGLMHYAASPAPAATATRKAANLYKIDGEPLWLRTRYCHEFAYGEEITVVGTEIKFLRPQSTCDIRETLKEVYVTSGDHSAAVSRVDDDLYYTDGGIYLQTRGCMENALNRRAILYSRYGGRGTLIFEDPGKRCTVENMLSKAGGL